MKKSQIHDCHNDREDGCGYCAGLQAPSFQEANSMGGFVAWVYSLEIDMELRTEIARRFLKICKELVYG